MILTGWPVTGTTQRYLHPDHRAIADAGVGGCLDLPLAATKKTS